MICKVDGSALETVSAEEREQILQMHELQSQNPYDRQQLAVARRNMIVGGFWLFGGLAVTVAALSAAASSPGGGSYVVAWGAILFGGLQFFRGVAGWMAVKK